MKTKGNYLRKDKNSLVRFYFIPILIAFLVLYGGREVVLKVSEIVTLPLYSIRHYFKESSGTVPVFFRSRLELDNEIKLLKQEVVEKQGQDAAIEFLMLENGELRNMLNVSSQPRILAGVISRPPDTPYDTMIIDRGSADGVLQHAPVYCGSNQAIGYIENVSEKSSQIRMFSSPGVESTVYVFGPNIFTTAYGEGGGIVRISIPQGIHIERTNIVVLPSLEGGVLGIVDDIQTIPTEPEQHAYVTLSTPIQSVRLVTVGTQPISKTEFSDAQVRTQEIEKKLFTIDLPLEVPSVIETGASTTHNGSQ